MGVQTGVVRIDPNNPQVACVTGNYSCPAGFAHLFVSVKQVADGRPDNNLKLEGSSAISSGWLERHPGPDEFTCDGTWHTGTWRITSDSSDPGYEYGFGALIPGQVYVQFCWDGPTWHAYTRAVRPRRLTVDPDRREPRQRSSSQRPYDGRMLVRDGASPKAADGVADLAVKGGDRSSASGVREGEEVDPASRHLM